MSQQLSEVLSGRRQMSQKFEKGCARTNILDSEQLRTKHFGSDEPRTKNGKKNITYEGTPVLVRGR